MIEILGVHPIVSKEPCHLVVISVAQDTILDWESVTQIDDLPQESWQVAYDEQRLEQIEENRNRWAFFFHYLKFDKPLLVNDSQIELPPESSLPDELVNIEYFAP